MGLNGLNLLAAAGLGCLVGVLVYVWGSWMDRRRDAKNETETDDRG